MHKPESVLENETHKILCDFKINTDQIILARKSDLAPKEYRNMHDWVWKIIWWELWKKNP